MTRSNIPQSNQIRQGFLDFFKSKDHTIVPSASLLPDSPNLLFTNAGMNQFVPIFLGQQKCPYSPPRAADTQKCIRAGGKHNDLEDVGFDTYHHTFFEMLGNWSFGDYFKREAIDWAWELLTGVWRFPANRLYATVYRPGPGDPSVFDQEASDLWSAHFSHLGLDPQIHVVHGNKKDNFWMMGETGPCGPCSELHVDLTPNGDTRGGLVNQGSASCVEIWNLVFIQYNANPDATFTPLPARHVDTGMGLERVAGIIETTKQFEVFSHLPSNYETDLFSPIFARLAQLSGKAYPSTLPKPSSTKPTEQEKIDIAFRVVADHIRTLVFSLADGILPGNTDRHYVLRRILRRAVRYGRTLGFKEPFLHSLVPVLATTMGDVFPEIRARQNSVEEVIHTEEESFNKTLDRGIELFQVEAARLGTTRELSGDFAFKLYDTYGFPLDLTALMAREAGLVVDHTKFEELMEKQRDRARAAQKRETITVCDSHHIVTQFVGYDQLEAPSTLHQIVIDGPDRYALVDVSPLYAEMGGQVGDRGIFSLEAEPGAPPARFEILDTQKRGQTFYLKLGLPPANAPGPLSGSKGRLKVDLTRRLAIERHHTVTHLLHWAIHQAVSPEATQKGSYVGADKLTFDFNCAPLRPAQIQTVEKLVNERILENEAVSWGEVPYAEVKGRPDVMQFFGDKYGSIVRLVQIGGRAGDLNGYSMELCGGTHTRATGQIGLFRILSEGAIAAGVRRIEAVAGLCAYQQVQDESRLINLLAARVNAPVTDLEKKVESLLLQQKELEKRLKGTQLKEAQEIARGLIAKAQAIGGINAIIQNLGEMNGDYVQNVAEALKPIFKGVVVLAGTADGLVSLVVTVAPEFVKRVAAGKIVQTIAPIVGGKGGGRPDFARGGGKDPTRLNEALTKAENMLQV